MKTAALIVSAGRGTRAATGSLPKQYVELAGVPVLRRTLEAFSTHSDIGTITVVIHADDRALYDAAVSGLSGKLTPPVLGGATRQNSVLNGLNALLGQGVERVLIHDAARPFLSAGVIDATLAALADAPGAIAALPLADTLKQSDADGMIARTVPREGLWRAQTPQAFRFDDIVSAHQRAQAAGVNNLTDDAAIAEWAGLKVVLAQGSEQNVKITTAEDLIMAGQRLQSAGERETRTGQGFDVHAFAAGNEVWLGGVAIPHTHKLDGHSDADCALHALTDALLGTIGAGDIGQHFPPSDMRWKNANSKVFLKHAAELVAAKGGKLINVDITILAEAPKIGPHRPAMQAAIGSVLGLSADRIGIKATTMERLGFIGRGEGIAAIAIATVSFPAE